VKLKKKLIVLLSNHDFNQTQVLGDRECILMQHENVITNRIFINA